MYDVIIIGAGSMGMAAGYYLTESGQTVALIDAFDPPHEEGSHHGETRLIRHAYGEGSSYVPLALHAQRLWESLEKKTNERIFAKTGVLNFGPKYNIFLETVKKSAEEYLLPLEVMTAKDINQRWPGFQLDKDAIGYFEKSSGVLFSENAIRTYRMLAEKNGADLYMNRFVQSIKTSTEQITVKLENEAVVGTKLLIAAGKRTNQVTKLLNIKLPLIPLRKTFSWMTAAKNSLYKEGRFPAWGYDDGNSTYYGFPDINEKGLKIGRHDGGRLLDDPRVLERFGTYPEDEQEVVDFTHKHLLKNIELKEGKVCTYTNTPDEDFIIDYLPEYENIMVACGFSGHGFKFASGIGECLANMLMGKQPAVSLESFRLSRFDDSI
ncbi:N-methyl-L-tryptophan oxidase [Tetragenococcus halophilus]|nr:N-methyl-L-tryptophan oxidase [Tetragenococcus halophilus]GBD61620.1 putative sarcosine oxidase [Tetragenococcus halophilus subsp. halophilus]MCO8286304.1 N-methyl-L-tryptophan oxidase [Tetragenococcus halophilus]NWN99376.1 N-methyl-L-tryptophan oxidase [Tetragenococcus halophilus]QXN86034.1 N-methyl-L-tryptophan oxidase [Tetragenococcus halophilus]WJS81110.1 N-methyl-L-tryptophan oxidase [Tetragenococcus halophilus]